MSVCCVGQIFLRKENSKAAGSGGVGGVCVRGYFVMGWGGNLQLE